MLLISLQPVLKHNEKCTIQHPSENIIDLFAWTYVISSIVVLPDIILKLQEGIVYILTVESGAEELYLSNRMRVVQTTTFGIYNLFASFYNVFSDFSIFLVFIIIITTFRGHSSVLKVHLYAYSSRKGTYRLAKHGLWLPH
jgi:hypothetical protein